MARVISTRSCSDRPSDGRRRFQQSHFDGARLTSLTRGISVGTVAIDSVSESLWPRLAGLLDRAERHRAAEFINGRDRRRQIAAHALKRLMLTACAPGSVIPKAWAFDADGQRGFLDRAGPYFHVSHCDGLVACGVSRRFRLGLDVKSVKDEVALDCARSQLNEREVLWLAQQPVDLHQKILFQLWNVREAYHTMADAGFETSPDLVSWFDPVRSRFVDTDFPRATTGRFLQMDIGQEHTLALAWQAGAGKIPIDVRAVHIEEMLYGVAHDGRPSPWRYRSGSGPASPGIDRN